MVALPGSVLTMPTLKSPPREPPLTLHLDPVVELDDDQLFELSSRNRDLRIERTASGELIVMPPAGGKTSSRNAEIVAGEAVPSS